MFLGISKTLKKMSGFRLNLGIKMNTWYGLIIGFFVAIFYLFYYAFIAACWVLYGVVWCLYKLVVWWIALYKTLNKTWHKGALIGGTAVIIVAVGIIGGVYGAKNRSEPEALTESVTESASILESASNPETTAEQTTKPTTTESTTTTSTKEETTTQTTTSTTKEQTTSLKNTIQQYVLNTNTKKIHNPSCSSVPKINPDNYAETDNFNNAVSGGYSPCGNCHPTGN